MDIDFLYAHDHWLVEAKILPATIDAMMDNNKIRNRFSKEFKATVVNSIVKGELWLEEAMEKYNVRDRRLIIGWLRKHLKGKG